MIGVAGDPEDAAVPGVGAAVEELIVSAAIPPLAVHGAPALIVGRSPPPGEGAGVWVGASCLNLLQVGRGVRRKLDLRGGGGGH